MSDIEAVHQRDGELTNLFKNLDTDEKGYLSTAYFTETLEDLALHDTLIKKTLKFLDPKRTKKITPQQFLHLKEMETDLIERALTNDLVIKDFKAFRNDLDEICEETMKNEKGNNAQYIPQLAEVNPDQFAMAFCSIDGQYYATGDIDEVYTVQSTSKPITYCMVRELVGQEKVTKHVGQEPSGLAFNAFALDKSSRPHNPMINLGAIMTCSLLSPQDEQAKRFDYVTKIWSELANSRVSFDNATYLSEFEHADRNYSLAYMAKDAGAFDSKDVSTHGDITKQLQFYFMCCSVLVNTEQASIIAATLANGGINPLSGKRVFSAETVRDCLSLMFSCGMYDYSGQFAFKIGLPAKSGVSGVVMLVIPDVAGVAIWSPRLDDFGNSHRGVEFCTRLTNKFPFHVFDSVLETKKVNPLKGTTKESLAINSFEMIFSSAAGDLNKVIALVNRHVSVNCSDYDGRTPLHLAIAEERPIVVDYLLHHGAKVDSKDRWGKTPLAEVKSDEMREVLKKHGH
eukprot:CAMPEP_0201524130 /NCGR_PEP_ID=MMETSP0161_2-20130828/21129_1 /ASSEMBLY_ACC=CAM_ASM_000251 /TAXON_ID=180227 /ORGANISM="Neoparamoeba aestuarina, Strain SoJaBio B1-5/56/2" /LENGTH=512 /DNA_ID=CAMNT_0047923413 /DNA_START=72 /DNA_END=1610 /DNA_ORIENTATION=-